MKLIVGLGNKGKEYDDTRHNIGFEFIDYFAKSIKCGMSKKNKFACFGEKSIKGTKIVLVKPLTYMNLSGKAVKFFVKKYKT